MIGNSLIDDADLQVVAYPGGTPQPGVQLDGRLNDFAWAANARDLYVSVARSNVVRVRPGSYAIAALEQRASIKAASAWSLARNGAIAWVEGYSSSDVMWHEGVEQAGRTSAGVPANGSTLLVDLDPAAKELELGRVEPVTWQGALGHEVRGTLLYPLDYQPGRRYPTIVDVYPLGGGSTWLHPMSGNHTWSAAGYAVFKPQPRAPHVWMNCSREAAFCEASKGPQAWDATVEDALRGVDEMVRRGVVDPDRMCLYGHSNGAAVVDYLLSRTDRFKCGIAVASGVADWVSWVFYSSDDWMTGVSGFSPWQDPAALVRLSPAFRADKVHTPMLLAVGDEDAPMDSIRMYNSLRMAGREVTLLRYPNQGQRVHRPRHA